MSKVQTFNNFSDKTTYVFESNVLGMYEKGSQLYARNKRNAATGIGEGITGTAYAIPTQDSPKQYMSLVEIGEHISVFLDFAMKNSDMLFQVNRIGCGVGGYTDSEIAPFFSNAPTNCMLPGIWSKLFNSAISRIIVAGSRNIISEELVCSKLDELLGNSVERTIVSGTARGIDTIGEKWAVSNNMPVDRFPAEWDKYKKEAGYIRNTLMAWYSTGAILFWDGKSPGTKHMRDIAVSNKLPIKVVLLD